MKHSEAVVFLCFLFSVFCFLFFVFFVFCFLLFAFCFLFFAFLLFAFCFLFFAFCFLFCAFFASLTDISASEIPPELAASQKRKSDAYLYLT